ncbi:MAG: glutamate racemase [Bacteroidetes bacterium]|nr:glutamate racemase [Bacteroidota bacterium]
MSAEAPIGIFDSGIGGTTIWKRIVSLMPHESGIYLADSKNAPYGTKSHDEIIALSVKNTEKLRAFGCKIVVVACNTATTNAIDYLRQSYDIPFIGIEPAIKPAALQTKTKKVGVLATRGTLSSQLFHHTMQKYTSGIEVFEQVGEGLVELIEAGKMDSKETRLLLKKYLQPMLANGVDTLVLGCTHFPFLIPEIRKIVPREFQILDSGHAVARQTKHVLEKSGLLNTSGTKPINFCYTNYKTHLLQDFIDKLELNARVAYMDF